MNEQASPIEKTSSVPGTRIRTLPAVFTVLVSLLILIVSARPLPGRSSSLSNSLSDRARKVRQALAASGELLREGDMLLALEPQSSVILGSFNTTACFRERKPAGSVSKLALAAYLLERGIITPGSTYRCRGKFFVRGPYRPGGRLIHEDTRIPGADAYYKCSIRGGHGTLTVREALARSCNHFFFSHYRKIDWRDFSQFSRKLGWTGTAPSRGIPVLPGSIVSPSGTCASILATIGHSTRITAANLAVLVSTIVNEGQVLPLRSLSSGLKGGSVRPLRQVGNPATFRLLGEAMKHCAQTGTARRLGSSLSLTVAAKTGSALHGQNIYRLDGWLASYAPASDPALILIVFAENSSGNGRALSISSRFYQHLQKLHFFNN